MQRIISQNYLQNILPTLKKISLPISEYRKAELLLFNNFHQHQASSPMLPPTHYFIEVKIFFVYLTININNFIKICVFFTIRYLTLSASTAHHAEIYKTGL